MHICPIEIMLIMMIVDYFTTTYHYYICGFKVKFLGAAKHNLNEHYVGSK